MNTAVRKVLRHIYNFDISHTDLKDGNEIITTQTSSEFVNLFRKRDIDNGIMVSPSGYQKGFVYKESNNGEIYNNPSWMPDIINFALDIFGLKANYFYKVTIVGRNTRPYNSVSDSTNDRTITVYSQEKEEILKYDFSNNGENVSVDGIFRAGSNEEILYFRVGKIYITDIIIDEVELIESRNEEENTISSEKNTVLDEKIGTAAYGIFTTQSAKNEKEFYAGRYVPMTRLSGKGINLYFDKNDNSYLIERDNIEDTIEESFTNINYYVDLNLNKLVNKGNFSQYNITEVSNDVSPNTLKSGFIRFAFVDDSGASVKYTENDGRLTIIIRRIF